MEEKHPKFIIQNRKLIIAKCAFHRDIADPDLEVQGGGWFDYDSDKNTFTLYGLSEEFGEADALRIQYAVDKDLVFNSIRSTKSIANQHTFLYRFSDGSGIINLSTGENHEV